MADPQCEDGYTKIANELLDALCIAKFSGREFRIIHWVIRKTYGWQRKEADLNIWEMAKKLRIEYSHAKRLVRKLKKDMVLDTFGLQKDYDKWANWVADDPQTGTLEGPGTVFGPVQNRGLIQSPLGALEGPTYKDKVVKTKENKDIRRFAPKITIPPTLDEVRKYCLERKNGIDPEMFIAHYEATGWIRGKSKIKNWKSCIITWERNARKEIRHGTDPIYA